MLSIIVEPLVELVLQKVKYFKEVKDRELFKIILFFNLSFKWTDKTEKATNSTKETVNNKSNTKRLFHLEKNHIQGFSHSCFHRFHLSFTGFLASLFKIDLYLFTLRGVTVILAFRPSPKHLNTG